jgi:DNA-binding NtrC family response regulator
MTATLQPMLVGAAVYAPMGVSALRVLMVTADAPQMVALSEAFQHSGVKLLTQAGNYHSAFAALEGGRFDVVVLDVDMIGPDFALFMRRASAQKEQQFVLVGAGGRAAMAAAAAMAVELDIILLGVLEKPFSIVQFGNLLGRFQEALV